MSTTTKKVVLNTVFDPQVNPGETEQHYGVPFACEATEHKTDKGASICILVAELPIEEAEAMIACGRVIEAPISEADKKAADEKAAADKKAADEKAADEKAAADKAAADKAAADKAAAEKK